MSNVNPRPYPFFKHIKNGSDEFIIFSDGTDLVALTFADFDTERNAAGHAVYPALAAGSTGREYVQGHKSVTTFQGQNRAGNVVPQERSDRDISDKIFDEYIDGIASYTQIS